MTFKELEQQVVQFTPHLDTQGQLLLNMFMPFCKSLSEENLALRSQNEAFRASDIALREEIQNLKNRLSINSQNSSQPPSKDKTRSPKDRSLRKSRGKKAGGQKGHKGQGGKLYDHDSQVECHKLDILCPNCQSDLSIIEPQEIIRRQIVDLPPMISPVVEEHQIEVKVCGGCGKCWQAHNDKIPQAEFQYGPQVQALALYLSTRQMIPVQRGGELLKEFGIKLSGGTLDNIRKRGAQKLTGFYEALNNALRTSSFIHLDETGTYVGGKNAWAHVTSNDYLSYFHIDLKRGDDALKNIGILKEFQGIGHHDCYKTYNSYLFIHSRCNAHLLRELNGVVDRDENQENWATAIQSVLLQAKALVEKSEKEVLSKSWQTRFKNQILHQVEVGLKYHPEKPRPENQRRGKAKQSKTHNLLVRIKDFCDDFLRFCSHPNAKFDNNQAERDIRMNKVKTKISGGFRSMQAAEEFMVIRSFVETLRKQGKDIMVYLNKLFRDELDIHEILAFSP
jgi:transposase